MDDAQIDGQITTHEFARVDVRVGTVARAEPFPQARKPVYKLWVNLGPDLGTRTSSAQITDLYDPATLVGRQVLAVVNLPPRRVGPFVSQVLVLGFVGDDGAVVLAVPDRPVVDGTRLS